MSTPYIGSKISLISKLDIRYEGMLHSVDPVESTISLSQVRSFGTEDRPAPVTVPARQEIYEFIIFKASDIKDLIVCETPKQTPTVDDITYDPAIVSVSKPPPGQQAQEGQPLDDRRSSAQEFSQASSPQPQQQQKPLTGGFGQGQRSYYNRAIHPQHFEHPPPPARGGGYHGGYQNQQQQQHYHNRQPHDYQHGQNRRGGGGGGQFNHHHNYQNQHQQQQQRRPHQPQQFQRQAPPKFDGDFDFERANEQFRDTIGEVADKLGKVEIGENKEKSNRNSEERGNSASKELPAAAPKAQMAEKFYDKTLSFFDNISCEALEKEEGVNNRVDWKKERMTNQETFGQSAVRMHNFRRGGRGGYRGYYHNNQGGYRGGGAPNPRYGGPRVQQQQQQFP